jgi:hypothetical protein
MSAKKRVVNKTSYYLISLDFDAADDRGSESVLGKVRRCLSIVLRCEARASLSLLLYA